MAETPETTEAPKKSGKLKSLIAVAILLGGEAALIIGAMMVLGGEPDVSLAADAAATGEAAEEEKITEVLVLDAKLSNAKSGVTYLYTTEIFAQTKRKHATLIEGELEQFYNEIKSEISAIWRTSDPQHFQEPRLENLTRKVHAMLNERFGNDPETGEPILVKCVLVMGTGFRVDA